MNPRHIGMGIRYPQLRQLGPDAAWTFELVAADQERLVLELSQTDATLHALTRLAGGRSPFRTTAKIVDVFQDIIYLQISADGTRVRADDPPLVLRAFARELPQAPDRIRLGEHVPVVLTWQSQQRATAGLGAVDGSKLPPGPWEVRGEVLAAVGPLMTADWRRLVDFSRTINDPVEAARFRASATSLASRSLSPKTRVLDVDLYNAAVDQGRVEARVISVLSHGALIVLTPMGEQLIGSGEANLYRSLGNTVTASSAVSMFVDRADAKLASFTVRLFDPAERARLSVGDLVDARIGKPTNSGHELHVHTVTGVEGLVRRGSLPAERQEGDTVLLRVAELPETGAIRLSGRHVRRLVKLSPQLAAAIQPSQDRRGWDMRPFASELCDVAVLGAPPTHLEVCSDGTPAGRQAAERLVGSVTGALRQVAVPNHQPLRASGRELLRQVGSETGCIVIDGQRQNDRGYFDSFVWVAGPDPDAAAVAVDQVRGAYPQVWVSDWFKRTGVEWSAATAAVKARSGRMRTVKALDVRSRAIFRVILVCSPGEETRLLAAARTGCPSIPYGAFTADPAVTVTVLVQSPPTVDVTPTQQTTAPLATSVSRVAAPAQATAPPRTAVPPPAQATAPPQSAVPPPAPPRPAGGSRWHSWFSSVFGSGGS